MKNPKETSKTTAEQRSREKQKPYKTKGKQAKPQQNRGPERSKNLTKP